MKITPIYKEIDKVIIETVVLEHNSSSENYNNWKYGEEIRLDTVKIEAGIEFPFPHSMNAHAGTKLKITIEKIV